jgi:CheY-like chemotaxis protein
MTARSCGIWSRRVAESSFDVLVSDIAMPDRDGYDMIRAVRALPLVSVASLAGRYEG